MKAFSLLVALMALSSLGGNGNGSMNLHEKAIDTDRPNGWYYVTSGKQDSLSAEPIVSTKEFAAVELDSFQNEQNKEMVYLIVGRVKDSSVKTWADTTEQSIGKHIGFVYRNKVICYPRVNARIESGNFSISSTEAAEMKALYKEIQEEILNAEINREHNQAWEDARKVRESITDSTFLKTKRPMSDDAIGPYNYQTGFLEDRAYNRTVYVIAIDRAKKHLSVKNNQLVLNLKSGAEINIAEDMYQYITRLFVDWNKWVKEGKFKIIKTEEGYYDIEPTPQKKKN